MHLLVVAAAPALGLGEDEEVVDLEDDGGGLQRPPRDLQHQFPDVPMADSFLGEAENPPTRMTFSGGQSPKILYTMIGAHEIKGRLEKIKLHSVHWDHGFHLSNETSEPKSGRHGKKPGPRCTSMGRLTAPGGGGGRAIE